jgi:glycerol kinase
VYFVPAFVGLGAPYWDMYARGTIVGLTRGTTRAHLTRAALEAIAYQSRDVLEAMAADAGTPVRVLRVDGGAVANEFLCQFQADIMDLPVARPAVIETTAMGAAYLAGLGVGLWASPDVVRARAMIERTFTPVMDARARSARYAGWQRAVERAKHWTND